MTARNEKKRAYKQWNGFHGWWTQHIWDEIAKYNVREKVKKIQGNLRADQYINIIVNVEIFYLLTPALKV